MGLKADKVVLRAISTFFNKFIASGNQFLYLNFYMYQYLQKIVLKLCRISEGLLLFNITDNSSLRDGKLAEALKFKSLKLFFDFPLSLLCWLLDPLAHYIL